MRVRLSTEEGRAKVALRGQTVEHPFGTMKYAFNQGYLLLKGLRRTRGEIGLAMLAPRRQAGHQPTRNEEADEIPPVLLAGPCLAIAEGLDAD